MTISGILEARRGGEGGNCGLRDSRAGLCGGPDLRRLGGRRVRQGPGARGPDVHATHLHDSRRSELRSWRTIFHGAGCVIPRARGAVACSWSGGAVAGRRRRRLGRNTRHECAADADGSGARCAPAGAHRRAGAGGRDLEPGGRRLRRGGDCGPGRTGVDFAPAVEPSLCGRGCCHPIVTLLDTDGRVCRSRAVRRRHLAAEGHHRLGCAQLRQTRPVRPGKLGDPGGTGLVPRPP